MITVARTTVQHVRRTVPREVRELLAVLLTAALHLSWPMTGLSRGLLVVPLIAGWAGHVWITARNDPSAMAGWGLRREGLREAGLACAARMRARQDRLDLLVVDGRNDRRDHHARRYAGLCKLFDRLEPALRRACAGLHAPRKNRIETRDGNRHLGEASRGHRRQNVDVALHER